tara:strand:+ start:2779 stop:3228 length:450 start_codon:yes stop_codon:yes gene_type:complete
METLIELSKAYRLFLVELGQEFARVKEEEAYEGFADTFVDAVKSPEIGFNTAEVNTMMKMADMFGLLTPDDLPSHHNMKLMISKKVDMDLLEQAQTLTPTDFKELLKDEETGSTERTYQYEVIKRCVETGNIKRVYDDEKEEALKQLTS